MTDDNFTAPPLATVDAAAREFGITRATCFRMIHAGQMPRLKTGEKGLRVPMHAARKMLAGEPIDPALLANPEVRSCVICAWTGRSDELKRNANHDTGCPVCGSTQVRIGTLEADETAA